MRKFKKADSYMRKINVYLTIGYPSAEHRDTIEVSVDATPQEIEDEIRDWANNYIEYGIAED